jgi:hypothetical protein
MTSASSSSPSASICSFVTDTKEDKAKEICEGLAEELEPLPETKAIVGTEGYIFDFCLGLVINLSGLELAEKLIHGKGVIVSGLNDSEHLHIPNLPI